MDYKESISKICLLLKIISNIKIGDKLYILDGEFKIDNRYFQSIKRTYFSDNRFQPLNYIEEKLKTLNENIIKLLEKKSDSEQQIMQQNESDICQNIILNLVNSKNGFANLKETYNTDVCFCSNIDMIVIDIESKLTKLKEIFTINI